jgi:tRNA pseudouridine38-40 synthase
MKEASKYFMGEHNSKSYTKGCEDKESYIRTIYDIKISLEGNILSIVFSGSGFLRYMVRNMVGTLIEVGANKIEPKIIKEIIEAEDRKESGICAPASGLYLSNVIYED